MKLETLRRDLPTSIVLVAVILLFLGPILFGLSGGAAISAYIFGLAGVALIGKTLLRPERRDRWLLAVVGVGMATTPWIMGFGGGALATWLHMLAGAAFITRANWQSSQDPLEAPRTSRLDDDLAMTSR